MNCTEQAPVLFTDWSGENTNERYLDPVPDISTQIPLWYSTQSPRPPLFLPCTPLPSCSSNTPESGDSVYVLLSLRPLLGFVQIGLFASPELPISDLRHHRVERRADVGGESPRGEGTREGGGRASPLLTLIRDISIPLGPPFLTPLPPFYVGVGALGAPYSSGDPDYISHRRAESLNQIYRFRTSERRLPQPALREEG